MRYLKVTWVCKNKILNYILAQPVFIYLNWRVLVELEMIKYMLNGTENNSYRKACIRTSESPESNTLPAEPTTFSDEFRNTDSSARCG